MNHRIVSAVVLVIILLFAVSAGLFSWALAAAKPPLSHYASAPSNPHPPTRRTDRCLKCHSAERGTSPVTHRNFDAGTCPSCHAASVPVLVPHSVAMGDTRCPVCHGDPGREGGVPPSHLRYESKECLLCHPVDSDHFNTKPKPLGLSLSYAGTLPHPTEGLFEDCTYCHQIGPRQTLPENHRAFAIETCEDCHKAGE